MLFVRRLAVCRMLNVWPLATGPEQMTFAQLLMLEEGLKQLNEATSQESPGPKRLRGEDKRQLFEAAMKQR